MANTPPENISPTGNTNPAKEINASEESAVKPGQAFDSYMKDETSIPTNNQTGKVSPFDLPAQGGQSTTIPTMGSILGQMHATSSVLGDLQNQLQTKNLTLKQSQRYLLRNKLSDASKNMRGAADKLGVDVGPPPSTTSRQNPIRKFLGLITDGQSQLASAQDIVQKLNTSGESISPGQMLLVQIKLAKAQQQLEYSSVLLSKAVDDIKTMFNIQI